MMCLSKCNNFVNEKLKKQRQYHPNKQECLTKNKEKSTDPSGDSIISRSSISFKAATADFSRAAWVRFSALLK